MIIFFFVLLICFKKKKHFESQITNCELCKFLVFYIYLYISVYLKILYIILFNNTKKMFVSPIKKKINF